MMRAARDEVTALALDVVEGVIPLDLTGHVFFIAPVGTVEHPGLPNPSGNTLLNGDGMICRLDLSGASIKLTTRLAETPDLVADEATRGRPPGDPSRFFSTGIARLAILFGARNFANTAFLPMDDGSGVYRLLLCYDAGRPFEIDPVSLEVVTPVGGRADWQADTLEDLPFPLVLSPAHPVYDPTTGHLFTANYGRSVPSMFFTGPVRRWLGRLPFEDAVERFGEVIGEGTKVRKMVRRADRAVHRAEDWLNDLLGRLPNVPEDFTNLIRWDGSGRPERFRLVLADDPSQRVEIRQSVHQVAVTEHYVVILDTAFKIGLDQGFNDPVPVTDVVDRALRAYATDPQPNDTVFYIVARDQLDSPHPKLDGDGVPLVTARRVAIPLEADHFLADYDDAGDRITVHVAHAPATDLSEWVREYDVKATDGTSIDPAIQGMMAVGAMDLNRFGQYVIDGRTGEVEKSRVVADDELTWAIALYTGRDVLTPAAHPLRLEQLYWVTEGVFDELLTRWIFNLYNDYAHRLVPARQILETCRAGGRRASIVRLDSERMEIADHLTLPPETMVGSMQFVPKATGSGATDGYLVCSVYTMARTEIWIVDADDLAAGPVAKLAHPQMQVGFSLHTAWLPTIAPRQATYRVSADEDFPPSLRSRWFASVRDVIENVVIPAKY